MMKKILSVFFLLWIATIFASDLNDLPERQWLIKKYLPSLSGKILFVGVNDYNAEYYKYVRTPEGFETLEILAERARYGSPYTHHIGDFLNFDPGYKYDHICLFGVLGLPAGTPKVNESVYTIVDENTLTQALVHANDLLSIGGTLQLGPSTGCIPECGTAYWIDRFAKFPLREYEILENKAGPFNLMWWGRKVK
jgi:hypothetical protein